MAIEQSNDSTGTRNVDTVSAMYEAFGRGDVPAILAHLAEDVDWESGGADHGIPWLIPGRGIDHVASFFERLRAYRHQALRAIQHRC